MMKKNGFTLAEVLITLAIIGVVATMTLPALMTNTGEQQAKTGLKKGINTFTEAAQMNQALEGWDYTSATDDEDDAIDKDTDTTAQSFQALIANRTSVDYTKGTEYPAKFGTDLSALKAVYFKDGSALYYDPALVVANVAKAKKQDDALSLGYVVYYDTNGASGPNIVSNCAGEPLGSKASAADKVLEGDESDGFTPVTPGDATTQCKDKNNKVIKDIFAIRLREAHAQPEGYAATWAFNGDVAVKEAAAGGGE